MPRGVRKPAVLMRPCHARCAALCAQVDSGEHDSTDYGSLFPMDSKGAVVWLCWGVLTG